MKRRGQLVRHEIPNHLSNNIAFLEPNFTSAGYSLCIEGSDGVGLKAESPWVRLFDPMMSPSATMGWYIVLHFCPKWTGVLRHIGMRGNSAERWKALLIFIPPT